MRRLLLVELVTVAVLAIVAALGFDAVFLSDDYLIPLGGAAIGGALLTGLVSVRRVPLYATAAVSFVGYVLWAAVAVVETSARGDIGKTFNGVLDGLRFGWLDLLTATLPAQTEPRLLVAASALTWIAGAAGADLAHRHQSAVLPILPALGTYIVTLFVAAGRSADSSSTIPVMAGMVAVSLLAMLLHANRRMSLDPLDRTDGQPVREPTADVSLDRQILSGLPLIGGALVLSMLVAIGMPRLLGRDAFDPRDQIASSVEVKQTVSPLVGFKAILARPSNELLFKFEADSPSEALEIPLVRLATLEDFDGAVWRSSAAFDKVGSVLPRPQDGVADDVPKRLLRQRIEISNLDDFWLPAAPRPVRVEFVSDRTAIQYDAETQTLVSTSGSVRGLTYFVVSEVVKPQTEQFARARVPSSNEFSDYRDLPTGLPNNIEFLAESLRRTDYTDFEQAQAIESYLRDNFPYDASVPGGHSYGHIDQFLSDPAQGGTAEQFAASFTVIAREIGLPTRIAVGFITTYADEEQADLLTEVFSKDVHAWPEVYFEDLGWISFDPTPARVDRPDEDPDDTPISGRQGTLSAGGLSTPEGGPGPAADDGGSDRPLGLIIAASIVLAVLSVFVALVALKFFLARLRRRRAESSSEQVLSAWADVLDRLSELGLAVPRTMTANEIAASSTTEIGPLAATRMQAMLPLVSGAVFAPAEPADDRADEMAAHARAFRQEVFANRSRFSELKAMVSLRPLFRNGNVLR